MTLVADKRDAAAAMEDFVKTKHPPSKTAGGSKRARQNAIEQADEMRLSGEWPDDMRPKHLVALYAWCHEQVYGVWPSELNSAKPWLGACSAAKRLAVDEFDGDLTKVVGFLRWTWARERRFEDHRIAKFKGGGKRIGWRLQFSRTLVTDFRLYLRRRTKR